MEEAWGPGGPSPGGSLFLSCSPSSSQKLTRPTASEPLGPSYVVVPTLPLTSWVTSAKLLNVSQFQLLPL